jgi:predicted RNase H-like HicB family nuclease
MLRYRASYYLRQGTFFAEVPGFPGVSAVGATLSDARQGLANSLRYAAEAMMRRGELLPIPGHDHTSGSTCRSDQLNQGDAYLVEEVLILPVDTNRVEVHFEPADLLARR